MKTLLIPIDFSQATDNALNFGAEWAMHYNYDRIIVLRSFYISMFENLIMSAEFSNVNEDNINKDREDQNEQLNILYRRLNEKTGGAVKVQIATSELPLLRSIIDIIKYEQPQMILLGSDNINNLNDAYVSGNVIKIAKASPIRILIVPSHYAYKPVKEILVPCDFNAISMLDRINSLRAVPQWHNVKIMVLNVDASESHINPDEKFKEAENNLHDYLKNFEHSIYYINDKNVINGILNFEKISKMQLMIAMPGKYSFLYSLTHKSISEALYRNTRLPLMILK
jgi:hypothetical protein